MPLCYLAKSNAMQKGKTTLHPVQQQSPPPAPIPLPYWQPSIKQELQLTHSSVIISLLFFCYLWRCVCICMFAAVGKTNCSPVPWHDFLLVARTHLTSSHLTLPCLNLPCLARNIFSFCSFQFAVFSLSCRFVFDTFGKLLPGCAKLASGVGEGGAAWRVELSAATSNIVAVAGVVVVGAIRKSYEICKASVISYLKCH